jgi:hypothetical protein
VHAGRLDFVDNALNTSAGTIAAGQWSPNPDGFLKAGMMGRLRLSLRPRRIARCWSRTRRS